MSRTPVTGTALTAALMLAFGIAAATTTFSATYAALLRPMPFDSPDRLLYLHMTRQTERDGQVLTRWSPARAAAVRGAAQSFEASAIYTRSSVGISGHGDAAQIEAEVISSGYLETLRVQPALGRAFTAAEDAPGHPVAMISGRLWSQRFNGDPGVLGRTVDVNGVPLTIVGVMPAQFAGVSGQAVLWFPTGMAPQLTYREYLTTPQRFLNVIARLRPGVTVEQARAELAVLGPQLPHQDPSTSAREWSATAVPLAEAHIDGGQRRSVLILLAGGGCVLLVTCVNVALLLLARARARRGEMAIRLALGASRQRLVRQLLAESARLAAAGAVLGMLLTAGGIAWLRRAAPAVLAAPQNNYGQIGGFSSPGVDGVILAFVLLLTGLTTLLFGVVPAIAASRTDPAEALAGSSRAIAGRGRGRGLHAMIVVQVAVAVLVSCGALLLVRTVAHLREARTGFDTQAITFWINAPASRYQDSDGPAVVERMVTRLSAIPGVLEAAVNRCTPYGSSCARTVLYFKDRANVPGMAPVVGRHYVSARYFSALGIQLRRGRLLRDDDRPGRPAVTVINETAAKRFWPNEDPIGTRIWFGSNPGFTDPDRPVEVVGVVADVKYWPLNDAIGPDFYTSYLQFTYPSSIYVLKARDAAAVLPAVRRAVTEIDSTLPIYDVQLVSERVDEAVARPRFTAMITALFAVATALLAAMGIFGVMAYSVSMRRDELALRLALGGTPGGLRRMVLLQAARLTLLGSAIALLVGLWLLGSLRGMLYGVSPTDPFVLAAAVTGMGAVALIAAAAPAWRASATDPMTVLRRT